MAGMIQFRLNSDYVLRFDALAARLGFNRTQVVRNLLSTDSILIDMIEDKAKTLNQISLEENVIRNNINPEELPSKITIRLDKDYEQRFNVLANSLGVNRVQVIRNLLSGDVVLISGVCKKAKAIEMKSFKAVEIEQQSILRQDLLESPTEPLSASQGTLEPQDETNLLPEFREENGQTLSKSKRGRKKRTLSSVDHSETRWLIIEHLNQKTGKNFGPDTKESTNAIDKMLDEGKELSEFIKIINNMVQVWLDDPKMNVRLCPETLFRPIHWEKIP